MEIDIERVRLRKGERLPQPKEHPQLSAIHEHRFVGHVTGYCNNPDCMARAVDVFVKNLDSDPSPPNVWCPVCRGKLSHLKTIGLAAWQDDQDSRARRSVNLQRYIRDHATPGKLVHFPLSAMDDDSLPA